MSALFIYKKPYTHIQEEKMVNIFFYLNVQHCLGSRSDEVYIYFFPNCQNKYRRPDRAAEKWPTFSKKDSTQE